MARIAKWITKRTSSSMHKENKMDTTFDSLLSSVDRFTGRLGTVSAVIERIADKISPQLAAVGSCGGDFCDSFWGSVCGVCCHGHVMWERRKYWELTTDPYYCDCSWNICTEYRIIGCCNCWVGCGCSELLQTQKHTTNPPVRERRW